MADIGSIYSASAAQSSSSASSSSWASSLDTQDFLKLLAAQMSNQDVMNPTEDTEFISQLAQFSSLEAMQSLTQMAYVQYGASLIGKTVAVAQYDSSGYYRQDTGVVDSVNLTGGSAVLTVNGRQYELSSVMKILNPAAESSDGSQAEPPETA